jgi:hypothetical protein
MTALAIHEIAHVMVDMSMGATWARIKHDPDHAGTYRVFSDAPPQLDTAQALKALVCGFTAEVVASAMKSQQVRSMSPERFATAIGLMYFDHPELFKTQAGEHDWETITGWKREGLISDEDISSAIRAVVHHAVEAATHPNLEDISAALVVLAEDEYLHFESDGMAVQ